MALKIPGSLMNLYLREPGDTEWQVMVCTSQLDFQITAEVTKRRTNCGLQTSVNDPDFSLSGDGIHNADPTSTEISYAQMKAWIKAKQKLEFKYVNIVDAGLSLTEGEGVNNTGNLYFTDVSLTASQEEGFVEFSFTGEGTGILDEFDDVS